MSPRRGCRKDRNHDEIRDAFQALGWLVADSWQWAQYEPGWPDLTMMKRGQVRLVEIKGARGKLTRDEQEAQMLWADVYRVVRDVNDVLSIDEEVSE